MEPLSSDMLAEHAEYGRFALLSALLLFPRAPFVRLVVALIAGLELAYAWVAGADQITIIWMTVLLGLALLILLTTTLFGSRAQLSPEEQSMAKQLMKGFGRARARHFIDQGYWLNARPGEVLLREGEPVTRFVFLGDGEARVLMGDGQIGLCRAGDVIGGLGFFSKERAAASVIVSSPARFWCSPADRLQPYFDAHPDLRRRIRRSMGDGTPYEHAASPPNRRETHNSLRAA